MAERAAPGTVPVLKDVIVDCVDPERLAAFWSELLDRPVAGRTGPYVWLARGGGPGLGFQRVAQPKAGKNRVHFDLASADPDAVRARVEALGGHRLDRYADGGFLVLADPEGNEFCVIPPRPFEVDDDGRTDYLGEGQGVPRGKPV
ncbi:VOC family protein [Streptomyces fradiae]|uniref:VOC family protein n=1 Tax=Streptomyces fradiae TaxID=1906 RepID=UPI0035BE3E35